MSKSHPVPVVNKQELVPQYGQTQLRCREIVSVLELLEDSLERPRRQGLRTAVGSGSELQSWDVLDLVWKPVAVETLGGLAPSTEVSGMSGRRTGGSSVDRF
jgi:hypothetical protein